MQKQFSNLNPLEPHFQWASFLQDKTPSYGRPKLTEQDAFSNECIHCLHSVPFIPSEAPPWDSRPVSGAGVVHYHLLHRPRSVPTALGPAPLVTYPHRPSQAGGYSRDCALLPPSPLSWGEPVRAATAYLGVRTDEAREKETEGWGVTETREGREKKKK